MSEHSWKVLDLKTIAGSEMEVEATETIQFTLAQGYYSFAIECDDAYALRLRNVTVNTTVCDSKGSRLAQLITANGTDAYRVEQWSPEDKVWYIVPLGRLISNIIKTG